MKRKEGSSTAVHANTRKKCIHTPLPSGKGLDTDKVMRNVYNLLWRDLSQIVDLRNLAPHLPNVFPDDVSTFRTESRIPENWYVLKDIEAKALLQLRDLVKRYRFKDDVYTDDELTKLTHKKFLGIQAEIAQTHRPDSPLITAVLGLARKFIRQTLGECPSVDEIIERAAYGKKADQGCPGHEAYLENKWRYPHTGSTDHVAIHRHAVATSFTWSMAEVFKVPFRDYEIATWLALVCVPKTWKIFRPINPNTRIGAWFTSGISDYMEEKLLDQRISLKTLQEHHRALAAENSITLELATADLTAASEFVQGWLLRSLLSCKWWQLLNKGRIRYFKLEKEIHQFGAFMGMGIGFTFPLQTLVFHSLLRSICALKKVKGHISVYGDDLIYPSRVHNLVYYVFTKLGFKLNMEKTYVKRPFRESCGGDYFRGSDVRPYNPEGQHQLLSGLKVSEFIYRLINGLKRRWHGDEVIPLTLQYLRSIAGQQTFGVFQVPQSFPDFSGERTDHIRKRTWSEPFWVDVRWNTFKQSYEFSYLGQVSRRRRVVLEYPYYWESLQRGTQRTLIDPLRAKVPLVTQLLRVSELEAELRGLATKKWRQVTPALSILSQDRKRALKSIASKRYVPAPVYESQKSSTKPANQTGSTSVWT